MYSNAILSFIYDLVNKGSKIWYAEERLHLFIPQNKSLSEAESAFIRENKAALIKVLKANGVNSKHYDQLIFKTDGQNIPLSYSQERLWFIQQYEQGTHAYHIPMLFRLKPGTDLKLLEKSLCKVVERHEILRSVILNDEQGNSIQSALNTPVHFVRKNIRDQNRLQEAIDIEVSRIFDLKCEAPIRVALFETEGMQPLLSIVIHHIAFDGWSMEVFIRELESFYLSSSELPEPALQYKDFAFWQRHLQLDSQLEFWKRKLAGYETLNLPLDKPRPSEIDYSGADLFFKIDAELSNALRKMAKDLQVSLYSLTLSAYFLVLRIFSNQDDIVVGTPIANRHYSSLKEIVGFFVNNIVLRAKVCSEQSIDQFIQSVGQEVIAAQLHQDLPFDKIVSEVEVCKDASRHPVFQVMFTLQSFGKKYQKESILEPYDDSSHYQVSYFDLTTFIDDSEEELQGQCNYATSLFNKETIEGFISCYKELLAQFVQHHGKQRRISEISYLNKTAYDQIVVKWNQTEANYPKNQTIHHLFSEQTYKTPRNIALVYNDVELTYQELDKESNELAHQLAHYSFPQETLIGICMTRSEKMVIAILAILKAGYAYVPIDPSFPEERIKFVLNDTKSPLVIVDEPNFKKMESLHQKLLLIDSEKLVKQPKVSLPTENQATSLAYVMYTSGTSGTPKGVMVEHRGIINLVYSLTKKYALGASHGQEGILQCASYVFDVSIKQMMLALLNGFKLVLMPDKLWADEKAFYHYLQLHNVTHLGATPSLLEQYDYKQLESVKRVAVGGELLSLNFYNKVTNHKALYNTYGVTEASVTSTFNCTSKDNLTIGQPISNVTCYVLNSDLSPVPINGIGELFIGGDGLARGYLNNPTLTAEKFISNPFKKNSRLYRTGDLCRRRPDGTIEYRGRNDFQVKIRGHRIELKEIEKVILLFNDILQCVVTLNGENASSHYLVAYYVSKSSIDEEAFRAFLRAHLPDFMVPRILIKIDELPLTINGKINTKALPSPHLLDTKKYQPPKTPLEHSIVKVWSDILEIPESEMSVEDSFFELGGNSILSIKLISKLHLLEINAPVAAVFTYRTIREFCSYLKQEENQRVALQKAEFVQEEDQLLSFAQERLWFYDHFAPKTSVYNIPILFKVTNGTDLNRLEKALQAIIQRHEILRTVIRMTKNGKGYQSIIEQPFIIPRHPFQKKEQLLQYYEAEAYHVFDLSRDYPIKISIYEAMQETYLSIILHHIAFDGWSIDIFIKELERFYNQETVQPLPIQYKDFALWQRNFISGETSEKLISFWKNKLDSFEPLNFPTDKARPQESNYQGANQSHFLDKTTSETLRQVSKKLDLSLHNLLLGAYCIVLGTYARQQNFVVGIPFAGRHYKEVESLIGFFVNSLPIKVEFKQSDSLSAFLKRVEGEVTAAQIHQDLPFENIVDLVGAPKDPSRHPIFQTMFTVLESQTTETLLQPVDEGFSFNVAKLDLTLSVDLSSPSFHVICNYAVSLFSEDMITGFLDSFKEVVSQIAQLADQDQLKIQDLQFSNAFEQNVSCKRAQHPTHKTIHKLFEEQVERTPSNIAVKSQSSEWNYDSLNQRANQMAHFLIQECRIEPGTLVSLFLDRNCDLVACVLGIFKAGGAYVPIDPSMPDERVAYMLADSRAPIILTTTANQEHLASLAHSCKVVAIDDPDLFAELPSTNPERKCPSTSLAYVIYTSGTTGFPKGVMVEHAGVVNLKYELSHAYGLNEAEREEVILQSSNYSFDPFVEQIILSLLNGHQLLIMPDQLWLEQEAFYEFLNKNRVTHINAPPSLLKQYDFCRVPSLKRVVFGGEVLTSDCFNPALANQGTQVINVYGPTEATIITTLNFVQDNNLCIGTPIANAVCFVLDEAGKTLPKGAVGELNIGGIGLARGYLNHPALTEEKFSNKLYRTGDLARWRHDGKLEYLGRIDSQVKIRGYRVELNDIENSINSIEGVLQCAVVLFKSEHPYLVGYVVANNPLDFKSLKDQLLRKLPSYMVPVTFIQIDKLPMTNGKLNYRKLPTPDLTSSNEYRGPTNEIESQLCAIWAEVLKTDKSKVSIADSFFNIGGNSIMSIQLISKINAHFKSKLTISDLFISESIALLAQKIPQRKSEYQPIRSFGDASLQPNLFMIHPGGCGCEVYIPLAKKLESLYSCYGVDSYHLNHEDSKESLRELAQYYLEHIEAVMEETAQHHYYLLGWSFGGQLALEIASLLEEKGANEISLFLLDYVQHDENILKLRMKISPEKAEEIHGRHLLSEGHDQISMARMRRALHKEEALMQQPLSAHLSNTRIILFKAMQPGLNFGEEMIKRYNEYVLTLGKNNIDHIVEDPSMIELVQLSEAHHLTMLTKGMKTLVEKISSQHSLEQLV